MKHDEQINPFAIVPVEVMMDNRLTLETMRVLVTLFSFRNKVTGLAFPRREAIAERCGMHPSNISAATTRLVELGWLVKDGSGGYGKATKYTISIPETVAELAIVYKEKSDARKAKKVAEQATVAQSATVAEQAIQTVAQSATHTVAQSATRIEQTNITNQVTERSITASKKSPSDLLARIDPQIASDFMAIRKAKNLPLTKTALGGIEREASRIGYSLERALTVCCERGWAGFKADWILREESQKGMTVNGRLPNKQEALEESNRAATAGWMPPELRGTQHAN